MKLHSTGLMQALLVSTSNAGARFSWCPMKVPVSAVSLAGIFIGCDLDDEQLQLAAVNVAGVAKATHGVQLLRGNAALQGGLPLADGSVDKILTDLPFGKQFGSLEENRWLYPRVLMELARVLRVGGLAVLLTNQQNRQVMQEALLDSCWVVEHRRSFRLFVKMDVCIYLLRRGDRNAGTNGYGPAKLGGVSGLFAWEDGSSWHEQWAKHRPALVPFGQGQHPKNRALFPRIDCFISLSGRR